MLSFMIELRGYRDVVSDPTNGTIRFYERLDRYSKGRARCTAKGYFEQPNTDQLELVRQAKVLASKQF